MFETIKNGVASCIRAWNAHRYLSILVIVVVIIVIWNVATMNTNAYDEYLYGLWIGDDEFCEDAEIDSVLLFIGESDGGTRNAYIVIQVDGEPVCNQGLVINHSRGWAGPGIDKYTVTASVDFDEEQLWSEDGRVKITVDMRTGIMRIWAGDQLYAKLYKSMEISNTFVGDLEDDEN